jgi:hypothetical protein
MIIAGLLLVVQSATGSLHGTVRAEQSREPVPHAVVEIPDLGRRTVADARGYYVLPGLPAGAHRVRAAGAGHDTTSVETRIADGASVRLDLLLPTRVIRLEALEVAAGPVLPGMEAAGPASTRLSAPAIKAMPSLGEADAFRAIQTLPSVAAASDFSAALYLRGGTPDQTLVTLDGAPLFNPYHLGGLFSAVDPDAIATVEVVPGALPARAGDRLSGAVHLHTRDGGRDHWRSTGGVSLISSRIGLDGPLPGGAGTMLVSVRRTYLDVMSRAAHRLGMIEGRFPYAFTDAHLKLSGDAGGGQWSVSGYLNDEGFRTPSEWDVGDLVDWGWGTRAGSARYRRPIRGRWLLDARAAASEFSGKLEVGGTEDYPLERPLYTVMSNGMAALEVTRYGTAHRLSAGVELNAYRFEHDVFRGSTEDLARLLPPIERTDHTRTAAAHVTSEWSPSEALTGRLGVRVLAIEDGATVVLPRAGARLALSPELALTAGAGRYAQTLRSLRDEESLFTSVFAFDLLVAAPAGQPSTSEDLTLGAEWSSGATTLRGDAYTRRFAGLTIAPPEGDPLETPLLVPSDSLTGTGTARGLELHATHRFGGRTAAVGYAWSAASRTSGVRFAPRFHRPHALDASVVSPLGRSGQVSARFQWASGQAFTPAVAQVPQMIYQPETGSWYPAGSITVYGDHNSRRLPAYRRLDLSVKRSYPMRRFGSAGTITPYVQVINALATRNVLFAIPGYDYEKERPVLEYGPQLPMIPTIGFEWTF